MQTNRIAALEERVRVLEAHLRTRRRTGFFTTLAVLIVGAVAGLSAATAQDSPGQEVIEAKQFMIRNESGQVLFNVWPEEDGAVLVLRDNHGRVTARLPAETELLPLTR